MLNKALQLHKPLWSRLTAQRDRLPHALLFAGPSGTGKEEFAQDFAQALLCENPGPDGDACQQCEACRWFRQDSHPDFRRLRPSALDDAPELEGGSASKRTSFDITIDQVRALEDFLRVGGHRRGRRVILISPAEAMNTSTANALLKSLEEPGRGLHFLLVSSRAAELLPTIRSRCQQVNFRLPEKSSAIAFLQESGIESPERLLALAGGAPYDARRLAEEGVLTLFRACLDALRQARQLDPLAASQDIETGLTKSAKGGEIRQIIDWIQRWVHDLGCVASELEPRYFPGERDRLKEISRQTDLRKLFKYHSRLFALKKISEHPLNNKLFLNELMSSYRAIFGTEGIHVR